MPLDRWKKLIRFRLRTLLILITFVCVPFGWIVNERHQSELEQEIGRELEEQGMTVRNDNWLNTPSLFQSWWEEQVNDLLGDRVRSVEQISVRIKSLEPLTHLHRLEHLSVHVEANQDLSPLGRLAKLGTLNLSCDIQASDSLPHLPDGLETLSLWGCKRVNFENFGHLRELTKLDVACRTASNTEFLGELKKLEDLALESDEAPNLTPLANLKNLKTLFLGKCGKDLTWIEGLENLERIVVNGSQSKDLTPLRNLRQLEYLAFYHSQADDLSPLAGLSKLKKLSVVNLPISDLGVVSKLTSLESLDLSQTLITDLEALATATSLRSLRLAETSVRVLTPLHSLPRLERLDISKTAVDLTTLTGHKSIESLNLSGMKRVDLKPVASLNKLKELYLQSAEVADLSPLYGLRCLDEVDVRETTLDEAQIAALKRALPKCTVWDNSTISIP